MQDDLELEEPRQERPAGQRPRQRGSRLPVSRPLAIAVAVVLAAAAFLFWPHGRGDSPPLGERYSVATASSASGVDAGRPRSGDVDLAEEVKPLEPETPRAGAGPTADQQAAARRQAGLAPTSSAPPPADAGAGAAAEAAPATRAAQPAATPKRTPTPRTSSGPASGTAPATRPAPAGPVPAADGMWLVQVGAFGSADNAEARVRELAAGGFTAQVKAGNTADGRMLYRVWIGYFATRTAASDYASRHRRQLGETLVQHR